MESTAWCYYLVPTSIAFFSFGIALFVSRGLKKRTGKIERELERLSHLKIQNIELQGTKHQNIL